MHAARVASALFTPLHTAIVDSGICTRLGPMSNDRATPEEKQHAWQWLIDWARCARHPPCLDAMTIYRRPGQTTELLTELLRLIVVKCPTLRRLTLLWPVQLETDAKQRRCAAEAIGAALLSPSTSIRLDTLALDLGDLAIEDAEALQRGAAPSSETGSRGDVALPRFQSVEWKAMHTSEPVIERVARLLGVVGVCEFEIDVGNRDLSCRTLRSVLQDCAATITSLKLRGLSCDDAFELEDGTAWSNPPSRLRELRVFVRDGGDPDALRAMGALLARVGASLTSFEVTPFQGALAGRVAAIIVARCPRLLDLTVWNGSTSFYEYLVEAYDDGRCGVSSLTVRAQLRGPDVDCTPMLEALRDATRAATCKLRVLTVDTWPSDVEFNTLIAMLSTNTTLMRAVLLGMNSMDAQKQVHALPYQFASRLSSLRRRLALASVCHGRGDDTRLAKLPPDVLATVFAFAGRRTRRYVAA